MDKNGGIYIGSDGLVSNERGSHGFGITSGVQRTTIWVGSATTCGNTKEMTFFRACRVYCNHNHYTYFITGVESGDENGDESGDESENMNR